MLIFILLLQPITNAQQQFRYANEKPNGAIRQFVDSDGQQTANVEEFHQEQSNSKDNLPACEQIPNLLCCTSRVLQKCYDGCLKHVKAKCTHKLRQIDRFQQEGGFVDHDITQRPLPPALENDSDLLQRSNSQPKQHGTASQQNKLPLSQFTQSTNQPTILNPLPKSPIIDVDLPSGGGFIEPLISDVPNKNGAIRISDTTRDQPQRDPLSSDKCGTNESTPAYLPCYSRQVADSLFNKCCRENVPFECRSLCTYEHREDVASKTLIAAVQDRHCDLKWLSSILYCANQNRDNRPCCRHLNLASDDLGVGDRCLRMCNVDEKTQSLGIVDRQDLVCLSNWNVIMYCARSGIRSLARS